jgi:SRSO17 transposase
MAEVVPDSKSRNLQQFLTHSKWDARSVIDHVARDANQFLGDEQRAGLLIDESGFAKQGPMSVGVSRQWLGRLGKVDNGQVAVFGVLSRDRYAIPVDVKLYLPKKWTEDPKRCEKAGIPEAERVFRTKEQLALEIVSHARQNGLRYGWVGADAGYGKGPGFCLELDRMGERFVVDLHSDFPIYLEDPRPYLPEKTSRKGPKFNRYRTDASSIEVKAAVEGLKLCEQPVLKLRDTTRGPLKVRALRFPVYVWDREASQACRFFLLATQILGPKAETKISLSNAPETMKLKTLAWMQLQRYWVERAFEDAKSECGMADYQVRKWSAWHHHMALVMMAMLFMLNERVRHKDSYPLLSCSDIEELLSRFLPRRDVTREEVIRQLEYRHRKRLAAIQSHSRNNNLRI